MSFKLAMQTLNRSLRAELSPYRIPVSLAAPLGSDGPDPHCEIHAPQEEEEERSGVLGCLAGGAARSRPSLAEYARHVVQGMVHGSPYILSLAEVGGGGEQPANAGCCSGLFGYSALTPAMLVLRACTMPLLALAEAGMPIAWREAWARCWTPDIPAEERGYSQLMEETLTV